ncbi:hypothetical protein ZWY2020_042331 [Hordeum vulgare]|nr:hypothetical protein ZWY2020_042331 [Hordeum vulgare]
MARKAAAAAAAMDGKSSELARAVAEAEAREERLRRELEAALARVAVAEEAEERLCVQLGELEAEAMTHAMEYQQHVRALSERLALMDGLLRSSGLHSAVVQSGLH